MKNQGKNTQINKLALIVASSSDSNTNPEFRNTFCYETEFVYLFLCTVNVKKNIHFVKIKSGFVDY